MAGRRDIIMEQKRGALAIDDQRIHPAVIVVISHREATSDDQFLKGRADVHLFEPLTLGIVEELALLAVRRAAVDISNIVLDVPVREDQIEVTVVVVVKPLDTESDKRGGLLGESKRAGD